MLFRSTSCTSLSGAPSACNARPSANTSAGCSSSFTPAIGHTCRAGVARPAWRLARPERLKPEERFDTEGVVQFLDSQGVQGHAAPTNAAVLDLILAGLRDGGDGPQLVVFFTNGSFDGIIPRLVEHVGR